MCKPKLCECTKHDQICLLRMIEVVQNAYNLRKYVNSVTSALHFHKILPCRTQGHGTTPEHLYATIRPRPM